MPHFPQSALPNPTLPTMIDEKGSRCSYGTVSAPEYQTQLYTQDQGRLLPAAPLHSSLDLKSNRGREVIGLIMAHGRRQKRGNYYHFVPLT